MSDAIADPSIVQALTQMLPWWVFCAIFAVGAAAYGILLRYVPANAHPSGPGMLFAGLAALIHIGLTAVLWHLGEPVYYTAAGLWAAFFTGLFFVAMDLAIIAMFRAGGSVSLGMPLFRIVASLGTVIIGVAFFAEELSVTKICGAALSCLGIYLLAQKTPAVKTVEG